MNGIADKSMVKIELTHMPKSEALQTMNRGFMQRMSGVFFLFDIYDERTFNPQDDLNIGVVSWLEDIKIMIPNNRVKILIGTS